MLIKTRKSFMFRDSSVNRPREMSLPQLPPSAPPRGKPRSPAQLARHRRHRDLGEPGGRTGVDA